MAGKRYRLRLSPPDETYKGKDVQEGPGGQPKLVDKIFNKREEEITLLSTFLMAAELDEKDFSESARNVESTHRFMNTEFDEFIEVDEEEVKWLRSGMGRMSKARTLAWVSCREIIRFVDTPLNIEE